MTRDAARLGRYVELRRKQLKKSQQDISDEDGPSDTTLSSLELGKSKSVARDTLRKLDGPLEWKPGSAKAVYEGGEPEEIDPDEAQAVESRPEAVTIDEDRMRVAVQNHPIQDVSMLRLMIALANLGTRLEESIDTTPPALTASIQETLTAGSNAVSDWLGGSDQLTALSSALQYFAKDSSAPASSPAQDVGKDSTMKDRPA